MIDANWKNLTARSLTWAMSSLQAGLWAVVIPAPVP